MVSTLGQLHRPPGWVWIHFARYVPLCQHHAPMALAPLIIRWGPDTSRDKLRRCARCMACGHKGGHCNIQAGSITAWAGNRSRLRTMRQ